MKNRDLLVSILLHALLLMGAYVLQGMILPYVRLNGLVPLLLPVVGTGVAIYEGRYVGGVFGIFAGVFCDVSFNDPAAIFTVLLALTGLLIGALADTIITRGFVTYFISCVFVLSVAAAVRVVPLFGAGVPFSPLLSVAIWQTVYSLVFAIPVWFFVRALGKRVGS